MTDSTKPAVYSSRVHQWVDAVVAAVAAAVTSVAYMSIGQIGDGYTFSHGQIQDALTHKFPFQRHFFGSFDVTLSSPQVSLGPARNRIVIQADAMVEGGLLCQPLTGPLIVSNGLHYDPPTYSIQLNQPSVNRFDLQNASDDIDPQVDSIGSLTAGQLLNDYTAYTFRPDQLRMTGIVVEPGTITILPEGVHAQVRWP